jgi:hypothetical protein
MKLPTVNPMLPRWYLGRTPPFKRAGFYRPFDLDPKSTSVLRGLPDNYYESGIPRFDRFANRGDAMNGYIDDGINDGTTSGTDPLGGFGDVFKSLIVAWNQQQLINVNIQRAAKGLPPISGASIAPQYNVGVAPETMNTLLMVGAVGLGVYFISKRRRK